ncbi:MAG: LysE family translocator [Pseudomonadota bacterium]
MAFETWIAFAAASALLLAMPGPTVLLVVSYALGHGWRAALPSVVGVTLGDLVAMSVSMAGLGALLLASADLYTALRWLGAAYLVYLGIQLWRARTDSDADGGGLASRDALRQRDMFRNAFAVTVLNPKAIVFFVAFVPQFLDPSRPVLQQSVIMIGTFVTLAGLNVLAYALCAVRARRAIESPRVQRAVNKVSGGLLIGAGAMTALAGKAQAHA